MAEQTGLRNNALPYPIYGVPFGIVFPMLDADGDLVTGATTPDAEISKNGNTFVDCTNESTEIATNSGVYYLLLTGAEMTADVVAIIAKSATSGMKTTVLTLYPRKLSIVRSNKTSQGGAAGNIILDAVASAIDDYYNGMICVATIDGLTEVRLIYDYVGSTQVASVSPDWNVVPDADDEFDLYWPEGAGYVRANALYIGSTLQTGRDIGASVLLSPGTGAGQLDITTGVVKANLVQILASAIAGTAAQISAAFTKFFDKATPTGTINSLPDAVAGASGGVAIVGSAMILTSAYDKAKDDVLTPLAALDAIVDDIHDTDLPAVKTDTAAIKVVTDNVAGMYETDGAVKRYTANALELAPTGGSAPTVAQIADGVWDEAAADHVAVGSTGKKLTDAGSAGTPPTVAEIADGVMDEVISTGHAVANSLGKIIYDNLNAPVGTVDTVVDGIVTELAKVPKSDGAVSLNATALAAINAEVDTALNTAIPGSPTADSINERVVALNNHIAADYGATEKSAIDLLDDAAGGLMDIHADVGTAITNIGDVHATDLPDLHTDVAAVKTVVDALHVHIDDIHDTDLPAVKTDSAAIKVVTDNVAGMYETDGGVKRYTANALEQGPSGSGPTAGQVADAVWDEAYADHITPNTMGDYIGDILGHASSGRNQIDHIHDTDLPAVKTVDDAIKAKTDNLPTDPADESLIEAAISAAVSPLATAANLSILAGYVDTEVASIKSKTDNLPSDPADESLIIAAIGGIAGTGTGAISWEITVKDNHSVPLANVEVWVSTNSSGSNVVANGKTDAFGKVTLMLDAGTYYLWKYITGYSFTNPQTITVS